MTSLGCWAEGGMLEKMERSAIASCCSSCSAELRTVKMAVKVAVRRLTLLNIMMVRVCYNVVEILRI